MAMTSTLRYSRSRTMTLGQATVDAGAMLARWVKAAVRALRHRREARILAGLNDHMLADIGLTRADVQDAFSEPLWRDPTSMLADRRAARWTSRGAFRCPAHPNAQRKATPGFRRPPVDRPARLAQ